MDAKLVVITGKTSKRLLPLQLPAVLGRSREAVITVAHPMISRRHCEIYERDGLLMLRDLASLNGTLVGGRKIVLAPLLPQGEFSIGPVGFRVLYELEADLATLPEIEYAEPEHGIQMPHGQNDAGHTEFEERPSIGRTFAGGISDATIMPASAKPPQSQKNVPLKPNSHLQRTISIPHDKLPTLPVPQTLPPDMPPLGPEYPEPEVVGHESAGTSPWDDGSGPQLPRTTRPPQKPHGHDAADEDFGNFLEELQ